MLRLRSGGFEFRTCTTDGDLEPSACLSSSAAGFGCGKSGWDDRSAGRNQSAQLLVAAHRLATAAEDVTLATPLDSLVVGRISSNAAIDVGRAPKPRSMSEA